MSDELIACKWGGCNGQRRRGGPCNVCGTWTHRTSSEPSLPSLAGAQATEAQHEPGSLDDVLRGLDEHISKALPAGNPMLRFWRSHLRAIAAQPSPLSDDDRREAFLALVRKWEDDAEGVDAMGYSQQADRIRACADDLSALLAQRPDNKERQP